MQPSTFWPWLSLCLPAIVQAQGDIGALLQSVPDLSTLLDLVTLADVNETLSTSSNVTIFAPTNAAFESLIEMDIPEATAVINRNVTSVAALLNNHVFRGLYPSSEIGNVPTFVQSLVTPDQQNDVQPFTSITGGQYNGLIRNGEEIAVLSGELSVSNVTTASYAPALREAGFNVGINSQNILIGEGIIVHIIDKVLMFGPPLELYIARAGYTALNGALTTAQAGQDDFNLALGIDGAEAETSPATDVTVFVPINEAFENIASILETADPNTLQAVLDYHILNDSIVFSPSLGNFSATTLQGNDVTFTVFDEDTIFVNDARIIFPNVILSNGVAHVIDSVLNPSNASFDRNALNPAAPASDRVQFANATSASILPFTLSTFTEAAEEAYTTPALLTTYPAVSVPTGVPANATSTGPMGGSTIVPYAGGAEGGASLASTGIAITVVGIVVAMM